jgi:DNA transposition AAA+ family ATPase
VSQYTLNFEPALPERFPTLRAFVAYRSVVVAKPQKAQAADMDVAPSTLSRKLNPSDGDTQRFNLDDLEAWLASTGDAHAVVQYLAAKFLDTDTTRKHRALLHLEALQQQIADTLASLKDSA